MGSSNVVRMERQEAHKRVWLRNSLENDRSEDRGNKRTILIWFLRKYVSGRNWLRIVCNDRV